MTMRSLSKNVEILPDSPGNEFIVRLSEAFSERLRGWAGDNPKVEALLLKSLLYDAGKLQRCPRCGSVIPRDSRYCTICGKALDPFAQDYVRLRLKRMMIQMDQLEKRSEVCQKRKEEKAKQEQEMKDEIKRLRRKLQEMKDTMKDTKEDQEEEK